MKNSNKNTAGIWMLVALVALLMAPIAVDHILHSGIEANAAVMASAQN